jgi:RHS repeat-associated protein
MSGVVRSVGSEDNGDWKVVHRDFDSFGLQQDFRLETDDTQPDINERSEFKGDISEAALLAVPLFFNGGEWDADAQIYVLGGRFYDPYSGRWVTDNGGENGYKFGDNNPSRERLLGETVSAGMLDDFSYYLNPFNNDEGGLGFAFGVGKTLGWTAFVAGSAGAGIIGGAGLLMTAGGYSATTAYATATGGAIAGGTAAAMQTYAANPNAGLHEYAFGVGLGAGFGGLAPIGGFADLGGSLLGGAIDAGTGGDFFGNGLQFGGLVGGIAGGGLQSGWRAVAWQGGGAAIGGGIGYAYGGDVSSTLLGANLGSLGGGIAHGGYQTLRTLSSNSQVDDVLRATQRGVADTGRVGLFKSMKLWFKHRALISQLKQGDDVSLSSIAVGHSKEAVFGLMGDLTAASSREIALLRTKAGTVLRMGSASAVTRKGATLVIAHSHPNGKLGLSPEDYITVFLNQKYKQKSTIVVGPTGAWRRYSSSQEIQGGNF